MDHEAQIQAIRAQGGTDADVEAYLRSIGAVEVGAKENTSRIHRLAQQPGGLSRLRKNVKDQNEADRPDFLEKVVGTADAAAQEIPGLEAVGTFARSKIRGEPYDKSLADLRTAEDEAPAIATVPARLAAMAIPGAGLKKLGLTSAKSGALLGGALPALAADDESPWERLARTVVGTAGGAAIGKASEAAGTVNRTAGVEPSREGANIVGKDLARRDASEAEYDKFRALGDLGAEPKPPPSKILDASGTPIQPKGTTPTAAQAALAQQIELPIIKRAIATVKNESPTLNKLPDTHASVLDAAYKVVGNAAWRSANGYTKGEAADALANAMEGAAREKGGSYDKALEAFRTPSRMADARLRGAQTLRTASTPRGAPLTEEGMLEKTPAAYRTAFADATPAERAEMTEGLLGELKQSPKLASVGGVKLRVPVPVPSRALSAATKLLRNTEGKNASKFVRAPKNAFERLMELIESGGAGQLAGRSSSGGNDNE